jgi:predicted nucleotidyltransferase
MATALGLNPALLQDFCRRHRIRRLSLFGSHLHDTAKPSSDVDLLVEFEPGVRLGLLGFTAIELELTDLLGRQVDLNTEGFLSPCFRNEVLAEAEELFASGQG